MLEETANQSVVTWHRRLGHAPINSFKDIKNSVADPHVLPIELNEISCVVCDKSKMTRKISRETGNSCKEILEKNHSDVAGPFPTKSLGGKFYYVSFIDEYSRYTEIKFLTHKNEVESATKEYIRRMKNQTGKQVKVFKSDNGSEYTAHSLINFFQLEGIKF